MAEYTFEKPSATPYVLVPFMFEPGRESLFKLTLLSDDRDDDGEPDFGFADVKPDDDWKHTALLDAWSKGGVGNQLGEKMTAGGPISGGGGGRGPDGKPLWMSNIQYQISLSGTTRCFLFLEMLNVKTDMRDVEGLQTEPDYPTVGPFSPPLMTPPRPRALLTLYPAVICCHIQVGFTVFKGRGNHVILDDTQPLVPLHTAPLKRGDGVCLELGALEDSEDKYTRLAMTSAELEPEPNLKSNASPYAHRLLDTRREQRLLPANSNWTPTSTIGTL